MAALPDDDSALEALRLVFGHDAFRPGQRRGVDAMLAGRDALVVLPTGAGKSVCYQVPAVVLARRGRGPTLVVSPLVALMEDQVAALVKRGVGAAVLHSGLSWSEQRAVLDRAGELTMLYVSPERVKVKRFRSFLARTGFAAAVVDEAHCISEWGHDFRKDYGTLAVLKDELGLVVMAATATATPRVRAEIVSSLRLRDPVRIDGSFRRPNLRFEVELHSGDKVREERVAALLTELGIGSAGAGRAVVYAATRKRVKAVAAGLKKRRFKVGWYHAGRTDGVRARVQAKFESGGLDVLVATTAFGMGVDHPDVRLVAHVQAPSTLESYYQQAGRAGRDGLPARCVLLYSAGDARTQARIRGASPGAQAGWKALQDYVFAKRCRAAFIEGWFTGGEAKPCGCCDVCREPDSVASAVDGARQAMRDKARANQAKRREEDAMALSEAQRDVVVEFVAGLRKPVGKTVVAAGLRGSRAKRIKRARLEDNPHFGSLAGTPERVIIRAVEQLLAAGRLAPRGKKYPTVWIPDKRVRPKTTGRPKKPRATGLVADLKAYRRKEARRRRWKAYQVFPDATIEQIVALRPATSQELLEVKGMGPKRIQKFGEAILELVRSDVSSPA